MLGPSRSQKTEWAKSLFKSPLQLEVAELKHFPDGMRDFDRQIHDGIVLDDLRDFQFLVCHQEKMQGKVDRVATFAETPGGGYAYKRWLWKVPIVVTASLPVAWGRAYQNGLEYAMAASGEGRAKPPR